jgi:hypothetical protein
MLVLQVFMMNFDIGVMPLVLVIIFLYPIRSFNTKIK